MEDNRLNGTIPSSIGDLTKLTYLYVECDDYRARQLYGVDCAAVRWWWWIYSKLSINRLSGSIPSTITNLVGLKHLYAKHNLGLSEWCTRVPRRHSHVYDGLLRFRKLNDNRLEGDIPSSIGNLSNLQALYVRPFAFATIHSSISRASVSPTTETRILWQLLGNESAHRTDSFFDGKALQPSDSVRRPCVADPCHHLAYVSVCLLNNEQQTSSRQRIVRNHSAVDRRHNNSHRPVRR